MIMIFPSREAVENLRRTYPAGCRIVLDHMDDPYVRIPAGTQGVCQGIDDAGNVMCSWDCGSSLSAVFGADRVHKVSTEEEAKVTLEWYGSRQPDEHCRCPRCGSMMWGTKFRYVLSRHADIYVCQQCSMEEALEMAGIAERRPLMKWCAIELPAIGGGVWMR